MLDCDTDSHARFHDSDDESDYEMLRVNVPYYANTTPDEDSQLWPNLTHPLHLIEACFKRVTANAAVEGPVNRYRVSHRNLTYTHPLTVAS